MVWLQLQQQLPQEIVAADTGTLYQSAHNKFTYLIGFQTFESKFVDDYFYQTVEELKWIHKSG